MENTEAPARGKIATTPYNAKLEPLFGFVRAGDYVRCKAWIDAGNPVLNPAAKGKSPLVEAVANGFFSLVEAFLDCGDWTAYRDELDAALWQAVENHHVSNVQILLDRGASPEAVDWYSLFDTHSEEITRAFLRHGKGLGELEEGLYKMERGCAKAMAEFVPGRPDLQDPIIREMAETLDNACRYADWAETETERQDLKDEYAKKASSAGRHFWLLASTGIDIHRRFEDQNGEETSLLEYTVKHGTLSQLRTLSPGEADWPVIAAAAKEMEECDAGKMKFLLRCGFKLNDREDGTSSFMAHALDCLHFGAFAVGAEAGGKLPELSAGDWKRIRPWLYERSFVPWMLPLLAGQVSESRMEFLLDPIKCERKFGRTREEILADLCHPETAKSPGRFAALMKAEKEASKGKKRHRVVRELHSLCRKEEAASADPVLGLPIQTERKCEIRAVSCSKEIWPWLFNFLDEFVAACEELGGKCELKKQPASYPLNATEVTFRARFLTLELPVAIREPKVSAPLYWSKKQAAGQISSGCLEITYERAGQRYPLGRETCYLEFKGKAPEMAMKLFKLAKRKQAEEEREAKAQREREERWEREAEERAKREAELAERRKREEAERAARERKLQAVRRKKAEDALLFRQLAEKAETIERCRSARRFLDEWEARSAEGGTLPAECAERLARLRRIVEAQESGAWALPDCSGGDLEEDDAPQRTVAAETGFPVGDSPYPRPAFSFWNNPFRKRNG